VTSLQDIKRAIAELPDPYRATMLDLVDVIATRMKGEKATNTASWTYQTLGKWSSREPHDPFLLSAVQLLSGGTNSKILDMHFLYFSPFEEDGSVIGEPVDDDDVSDALRTGEFYDPETGGLDVEFKKHLVPYFVPNREVDWG